MGKLILLCTFVFLQTSVVINAQNSITGNSFTLHDYTIDDKSVENTKYSKLAINSTFPAKLEFTLNADIEGERAWSHNGQPLTVVNANTTDIEVDKIYSFETIEDLVKKITLVFNKPVIETAGNYTLNITKGKTSYTGTGYINSPPIVKSFSKSKRGLQGDEMTIVCEVQGYPLPTSVVWGRDTAETEGDTIDAFWNIDSEKSINVTKTTIANDTLKFKTLEFSDAGIYRCNASNDFGSDTARVQLRVKDRLAALWPFIGIVIEVVVLVAAILLYEKKRASAKKAEDEEDTPDQAAEPREKAVDGKDEDVRQRGAVKA